ncbi:hypothetical protein HDV05_002272 [Chytridiales sp. JEL 0842]|nr:hypothetical protein HDV05_002272 [Chytridiales sp. JEL 0842]
MPSQLWRFLTNYFPAYHETRSEVILIHERPPWSQLLLLAAQHMLAMFGGFDPNTSLFLGGLGTIIFFIVTGGKVPSYLGCSFAYIGVVLAATGYNPAVDGPINPKIGVAMGGIIASGIAYGLVGVLVMFVGHKWIDRVLPPVVTGSIIMAIGLALAHVSVDDASLSPEGPYQALFTAIVVAIVSVFFPGFLGRLPVLIGLMMGFVFSIVLALKPDAQKIDWTLLQNSPWVALPTFYKPEFASKPTALILPVFIIMVAENLGHVKAVSVITLTDLNPQIGRAFVADALATIFSGSLGGLGLTTYSENIGVMAVTRVYSTLVFLCAAVFAILLGLIPKFGALVRTIPPGVYGGLTLILFGLVASMGARIWITAQVDFSKPVNLIVASVAIVLGAGMSKKTIAFGEYLQFDGLGTATIVCILVNLFFGYLPERYEEYKKNKKGGKPLEEGLSAVDAEASVSTLDRLPPVNDEQVSTLLAAEEQSGRGEEVTLHLEKKKTGSDF